MAATDTSIIIANAASVSLTGISVVILGVQTGLEYPTLIAGVLGGATALSYSAPSKLLNRAFEVVTASLLAGYSSPVLTAILINMLVKFNLITETDKGISGMELAIAFAVGYLAHGVLLPGLRKVSSMFIRRAADEPTN